MNTRQTRQYETLVRVRKFGSNYGEKFAEGSEGRKAFAVVATAIADVESFSNSKLTARREGMTKFDARRALAARIDAIAITARKLAKTVPGADIKFPKPVRQSDVAVLTSGRLFLREAPAVKDAFVRSGLPEGFVEGLQQAVATFEAALENRDEGKVGAAVSQAAIRTALRQAMDAIDSLDAFVANALGDNTHAMSAWRRCRRVDLSATNPSGVESVVDDVMPPAGEAHGAPSAEPAPASPAAPATPADAAVEPLRRAS